jgi:hypothetical protein
MSDIAIQPAPSLHEYNKFSKFEPFDLVVLDSFKKSTEEYFIATKSDHGVSHYSQFVGFFFDGKKEDIIERYAEIIASTPTTSFVQIKFPMHRIREIRSLVYRHKAVKQQ